jgi:hypothetical protein
VARSRLVPFLCPVSRPFGVGDGRRAADGGTGGVSRPLCWAGRYSGHLSSAMVKRTVFLCPWWRAGRYRGKTPHVWNLAEWFLCPWRAGHYSSSGCPPTSTTPCGFYALDGGLVITYDGEPDSPRRELFNALNSGAALRKSAARAYSPNRRGFYALGCRVGLARRHCDVPPAHMCGFYHLDSGGSFQASGNLQYTCVLPLLYPWLRAEHCIWIDIRRGDPGAAFLCPWRRAEWFSWAAISYVLPGKKKVLCLCARLL